MYHDTTENALLDGGRADQHLASVRYTVLIFVTACSSTAPDLGPGNDTFALPETGSTSTGGNTTVVEPPPTPGTSSGGGTGGVSSLDLGTSSGSSTTGPQNCAVEGALCLCETWMLHPSHCTADCVYTGGECICGGETVDRAWCSGCVTDNATCQCENFTAPVIACGPCFVNDADQCLCKGVISPDVWCDGCEIVNSQCLCGSVISPGNWCALGQNP